MKHDCQILYFLFCIAWSYSYGTVNIVMAKNSWYYDFYKLSVNNLLKTKRYGVTKFQLLEK